MKLLLSLLVVLTAALGWTIGAQADEKIDLKVLYTGNSASDRAMDFTAFLEKHFSGVTAIDIGKFKEGDADGQDVVIFDWTSIYNRDAAGKIDYKSGSLISMPPWPRLSENFARPTMLIGAAGGRVAGALQIKIDWL
jgi:hypothetical protein